MADAVEQLIEVLQDELQSQQQLAAILENKLDAMRHYDMSRLEVLASSEQKMLETLRHKSIRRNVAGQRLTAQVFPRRRGQIARVKELAEHITGPRKEIVLSLSAVLKTTVEKVQRLSHINAVASQKVLKHLDHVFKVISQTGCDVGLYSRGGKKAYVEQNRLVDAMA